ncbi:SCO1664 family protein [Micrococcus sp. EYE_162]|uniref:SCO1664 family protein n=1 Tax=unclassified Micrococcus TaxID=2620948 RepID=UPI0020063AB7|nr:MULTISPECIES: SCO1664 family protein [unclassified Micrococcus]MCK6095912.1 SCO1664 family protein [Micrococcus sp. EYE_212]MCK6172003.1 SCO1664 family protein [Micrococcus sp. EYE_162]
MSAADVPAGELMAGELTLTGRITTASNATFLGRIGDTPVVYKPVAGEAPLWDFPAGTLARREVAAYLVSEALGWDVVPRTWLRDGPFGEGMVQLWQEQDPEQDAVDLFPADEVPASGWLTILEGEDEGGNQLVLAHEDSAALRRMAVFDVVVNNADRKGAHILAMPGGHRYGVDHGLTFHVADKLRTVLWGWIGEELSAAERDGVARVLEGLDGELGRGLAELLSAEEVEALAERCARLLDDGIFPAPSGLTPAVPWPLF